jgi:hypothetical protein
MGEPLLAVSMGSRGTKELLDQAMRAAKKGRRGLQFDSTRFVAYSYPKLGVQFTGRQGSPGAELGTWAAVLADGTNDPPLSFGEQAAGHSLRTSNAGA